MDRVEAATSIVKDLNLFLSDSINDYDFIKKVCDYFDKIKGLELSASDLKFLKYISNVAGVPHYYDLLLSKFNSAENFEHYDLNTVSSMLYESTLHIDEKIKIHKFQKQVLNQFRATDQNRYFLSATTSFGKTFLIYEIIKKLSYDNIVLIFPTIALLSENYERLFTDDNFRYFYDGFDIHTLSDIDEFSEKNIFIFTPERYLSFIDKHPEINIDFVFVDEIYKIDNEFIIDTTSKENERDTAYRVALKSVLDKSQDILLVGPYIDFPDKTDSQLNQSFNTFLNSNKFKIIDYNKYEIVSKSSLIVRNATLKFDDELTIDLKGYSQKSIGSRISKIVDDIRSIKENLILYTKGPGKAESYAKDVISLSTIENDELNSNLQSFISHLLSHYKYNDWVVINALQNKVGIHHGLVPKYIQKEIINFFNDGHLDVLISTTTITEGVNTSAKNLLVVNSTKGNKDLKTFDAKNIAGRAGRFLHHFSGRVIILDKKFKDILEGSDSEIKHKNFDPDSNKDEIDYFITDESFLSQEDILKRREVIRQQNIRGIPDEIMSMYKVISHSDKIRVYDQISSLPPVSLHQIRLLISSITRNLTIDYNGFKVVLSVVKPIVSNKTLAFLINNESILRNGTNTGNSYPTLVYSLSAYLSDGFAGIIKYNLSRKDSKGNYFTTDKAIQESSRFVFNTLKYQLVKYLGVFNVMYKFFLSKSQNKPMDDIVGLDRLLLKLEYNATSDKARLASDYGVPSKIVEYYDEEESEKIRKSFDAFEESKFQQIESILNKQ